MFYLHYRTVAGPSDAWGEQSVLAEAILPIDPALKVAPHQVRLSLLKQRFHK